MTEKSIKVDCHYCDHACCDSEYDKEILCFCEDGGYYSGTITDSSEALKCMNFVYCDVFPKY